MALTNIEQVRLLVQDNKPGLYILQDDEIEFLLERNADSVNRTSIEAARIILFKMSMRSDESVDIFSVKSSQAAEQYRLALQLYLKDPSLNPILNNVRGYFGGVSLSDMQANDANTDNNLVPVAFPKNYPSSDPFSF